MRFKLLKKKVGLVFIFLLTFIFTVSMAYAVTNGSVSISGSGGNYVVTDHNGSVITPNPESISPNNFLFFNSRPAPNASSTSFSPSEYLKYTSASGFNVYRYDFSGTGNVYVLVLANDGLHYTIIDSGNYYTGTTWLSSPLQLSGTEAKDYFISGQTDYVMKTPYAPSAISVTESQERIGDTTNTALTLNVGITADYGSGVNKRQIADVNNTRSYALLLYKDGETNLPTVLDGSTFENVTGPVLIRSNSSSITIKGTYLEPGKTYRLIAWNRNWWTPSSDQPSTFTEGTFGSDDTVNYRGRTWTTLSGGISGPQSFTLTLESGTPDKPGINFFAMPFAGPWYVFQRDGTPISVPLNGGTTTEVKTAYQMVKAINIAAGQNVVSTFGRWDKTATVQKDVGVLIPGNDPDKAKSALQGITLQQGEGYQVYVTGTSKVELVIKNAP